MNWINNRYLLLLGFAICGITGNAEARQPSPSKGGKTLHITNVRKLLVLQGIHFPVRQSIVLIIPDLILMFMVRT